MPSTPYDNTFGQSVRRGLSQLLGAGIYQSPYGTYQTIAHGFNPVSGWSQSQVAASQLLGADQANYNSYMRQLMLDDPGYSGNSPSQPSNAFSWSNPFAGMFQRSGAPLPSYAQNYQQVPQGNYMQGNTLWGQSVAPSWDIGGTTGVLDPYTGGPAPASNQYIGNGQGAMRAPASTNRVGSLAGGSITSRSPYGMVVEGEAARDMMRGMQGPSHRATSGETTNQLGGVFTHAR